MVLLVVISITGIYITHSVAVELEPDTSWCESHMTLCCLTIKAYSRSKKFQEFFFISDFPSLNIYLLGTTYSKVKGVV